MFRAQRSQTFGLLTVLADRWVQVISSEMQLDGAWFTISYDVSLSSCETCKAEKVPKPYDITVQFRV